MGAIRVLTAGESHGQALTVIIEGFPAGLRLDTERINELLKRRQGGYGRGGRMSIEKDRAEFVSGVVSSVTLGSPLALQIANRDWVNWKEVMDPIKQHPDAARPVTRPRPGHADLAGGMKYRQKDLRWVLERASARETAARVAAGAVAKELLLAFGIRVQGIVAAIGGIEAKTEARIYRDELYANPLFCPDEQATKEMVALINQARENGDSLGGVIQITAEGLPPGLGSHTHWDRRLDGLLAQAVMSIPAVKGIEIGLGFRSSHLPGSKVHDEIFYTQEAGFYRKTNRAGGLEGGITNGSPLLIRAAMKPIPTLVTTLNSVDIITKEPQPAAAERSDVCAVPACAIAGEAAVAWVLAAAFLDKFGGDHIDEISASYKNYLSYLSNW